MSVDPTTIGIGVGIGVVAGVSVSYYVFSGRSGRTKVKVVQRDESGQLRKKTVTEEELNASKREMRTLMLERDLLQAALTKVYEAETAGQITREERELIARKYSSQIREFEAQLRDKELVVEVGELEGLRDELVSLFREKIQNIESRLDQAKERLPVAREEVRVEPVRPARAPVAASTPAVATVAPADDLERVVERRAPARSSETDGEKRVNALRDEVLDALTKLEQIDTKKETEGT